MISAEAPALFSKACELFILEITHRTWMHTQASRRRTIQKSDVAVAISKSDMFDFLIDIVPRDEIRPMAKKAAEEAAITTLDYQHIYQMPPLTQVSSDGYVGHHHMNLHHAATITDVDNDTPSESDDAHEPRHRFIGSDSDPNSQTTQAHSTHPSHNTTIFNNTSHNTSQTFHAAQVTAHAHPPNSTAIFSNTAQTFHGRNIPAGSNAHDDNLSNNFSYVNNPSSNILLHDLPNDTTTSQPTPYVSEPSHPPL